MNARSKYLGKNTVVFGISAFATKILSFFLLPLYTDILTTAEYGTADVIATTANLLLFILTMNIADSVMRYTINNKEPEKVLSYGFRVLWIGSIICCVGVSIIYFTHLLKWPVEYFVCLFFTFFATALYSVISSYLRGVDKIFEVGVAGVISSVTIIFLNILFLKFLKIGVLGYLISMIMGPLVSSLYCILVSDISYEVVFKCTCNIDTRKMMRGYCVPLIFNNIALWINSFLDRYFIVAMCGVDENGVYSMANKIPIILSTLFSVFTQAWGLSAIHEIDSEDSEIFFTKIYKAYVSIIFTVCSVLIIFDVFLAKILFKKEFFIAWKCAPILLLAIALNAMTAFFGSIFSAAKRTSTIATTTIVAAIVNISLNYILIPQIGIYGAAIATLISYLVMLVIRICLSRKILIVRNNYLRDIMAFVILIVQIIFCQFDNHLYVCQACCLVILMILYRKPLINILVDGKKMLFDILLKIGNKCKKNEKNDKKL